MYRILADLGQRCRPDVLIGSAGEPFVVPGARVCLTVETSVRSEVPGLLGRESWSLGLDKVEES